MIDVISQLLFYLAIESLFSTILVTNEGDGGEIKCLKLIDKKLKGKTVKLQNHNNSGNLKWATWIIARLGGWEGYDSQGPPGIIVLKRGLDKFSSIFYGWKLATDVGIQQVANDDDRGEGKHASYDNETVKRLEDIQTLDGSTKSVLFNIIDTFLRDAKARKAYA